MIQGSNKKRKREEEVSLDEVKDVVVYKNKTPYKKRNNRRNTVSYIMRGPNIVPDSYTVKMVWLHTSTITSTSGAPGHQIYRGNSLYDPDLTGTGTQPAGFDELMALYKYYRVIGSAIEITAMSNNTSIPDDMVLRPALSSSIVGTATEAYAQNPYAIRKTGFTKEQKFYFKSYMATNKIYGVSKTQVTNEDEYSGSASANASNEWYWVVSYQSLDRTATQGMYINTKMTFYATFYNRNVLNQS